MSEVMPPQPDFYGEVTVDQDEHYFTTAELRAQYPDLANETRYPDAVLEAARAYAEQRFERAANVAFVERTRTDRLVGNGKRAILVTAGADVGQPTAVTIAGAEVDEDGLAAIVARDWGALEHPTLWPKGAEIVVTYPYGSTDEIPEPVKGAVMTLAAERALPSTVPARATVLSTDVGSYRMSIADRTGKTGIPEVDAVIAQFGAPKPVTG